MPIITNTVSNTWEPENIQKNIASTFTLDKAALAALPLVDADLYYKNIANWNVVILSYKSSIGNQTEFVKFDATQSSPSGTFLVSDKARDIFQIYEIIIKDFDGGFFVIPRSQLNESDFDVVFSNSAGGNRLIRTSSEITNNFIKTGELSNGSYAKDIYNYFFSTTLSAYYENDFGSAATLLSVGIGVIGFQSTPDSMEWVPTQITVFGSLDGVYYTDLQIFNFVRSDWTAETRKDLILNSPANYRYYRVTFNTVDNSFGSSLALSEISFYN